MGTFPGQHTVVMRAAVLTFVLMMIVVVSIPIRVAAQTPRDGERTLEGLLRRLITVATDPDNYTRDIGGFDIFLTTPTASGEQVLGIRGDAAEGFVSYSISQIDSSSFCVLPNLEADAVVPVEEGCFDFTQIARIRFDDSTERDLQEMPLPGEQKYPQIPGLSGLAARYHRLNDPLDKDPMAYTGYFLQFRHSITGDNSDGLGMFVGIEFGNTDAPNTRVEVISYQQDYLCLGVLRAWQPLAGMISYYCIPHTNIASIRLLRNRDVFIDVIATPEVRPDVSEFLAAQQGRAEPVADSEIPEPLNTTQNTSDVSADVLTWWESGQGSLELMLRVPIDDRGTSLIVAHDATISSAAYVVTEVGAGYLCMASADVTPTPTIGDLCTTFDNIAQVVR